MDSKKFNELETLFREDTSGDWFLGECSSKDCWCTPIGLTKFPNFDADSPINYDEYTYVASTGCIPTHFAKLGVEARNNILPLMEKLIHAEAVIRSLTDALLVAENETNLYDLHKNTIRFVESALRKQESYTRITKD